MNQQETDGSRGLTPAYLTYVRQKCFIAYSQQASWADDLLAACEEVLARPEFDLEPDYAIKHYEPGIHLHEKVRDLIANARYGIYDLSYWLDENDKWHMPSNVLIELGMAIALNRPTMLIRHCSNSMMDLPSCLSSVQDSIIEFGGVTSLKEALTKRLPRWVNAAPESAWWNRYCVFGGRVCGYREAHPRVRQWGSGSLKCHVSDGVDVDQSDFRATIEEVLGRFGDLDFGYLDTIPQDQDYQFRICTYCQTVRSTPFAIYRTTADSAAETYIAIGMSMALETQFEYKIPKILLANRKDEIPALLAGYDVVIARNDKTRRKHLRQFMPSVIHRVREVSWHPRTLPFQELGLAQAGSVQPDQKDSQPVDFAIGQLIEGTIVSIAPDGLTIDIGSGTRAYISNVELQLANDTQLVQRSIGDTIRAYVSRIDERDGIVFLSISNDTIGREQDWLEAERLLESDEVFETEVVGYNRGGVICRVGRIRGFVPASQLVTQVYAGSGASEETHYANLVGRTLWLKVVELDRKRNRLILSERLAQRERRRSRKEELLGDLKKGDIIKGRVSSLAKFGAFVDLGGADGLIHLSELSWSRVNHPSELIQVGDEVQVYVLNVDRDRKRIGLSLRRLEPEPWSVVHDRYAVGQIVEGVITKLASFGAFARVDGTLEGLIHISELANHRITHPREVVKEGDVVNLRIIRIDPVRRRLGLSLKRATDEEYVEMDWREHIWEEDEVEPQA